MFHRGTIGSRGPFICTLQWPLKMAALIRTAVPEVGSSVFRIEIRCSEENKGRLGGFDCGGGQ